MSLGLKCSLPDRVPPGYYIVLSDESLNIRKSKHQKTNNKRFDRLTTLSQVEGQYPNSKLQCPKQVLTCHMVFPAVFAFLPNCDYV